MVLRVIAGLRAEGEAVPALLGMIVMELQRGATLSRVQARGGNLSAAFKAQRVWDAKKPMYKRALQRHLPRLDSLGVDSLGADDREQPRHPG